MRYVRILLAATSLLAAAASPALTADMDEPILVEATDEYKPVEIGSGWYLRGDVGYAFNNDFERIRADNEYDSTMGPFSGSVGIGYHFNDFVRADVNLGILPNAKYIKDRFDVNNLENRCDGWVITDDDELWVPNFSPCVITDEAENYAYDLMANAYVDLGTYSGFTPYIGGGIGVLYTTLNTVLNQKNCIDDQLFQCSDNPNYYAGQKNGEAEFNVQFALAAGLSYRLSEAVSLDLGYEYKSAPGAAYYVINDSGDPVKNEGLDFHSAKLGFRYDLW